MEAKEQHLKAKDKVGAVITMGKSVLENFDSQKPLTVANWNKSRIEMDW